VGYKFKKGDLAKLGQASAHVDKRNSLEKPAAHTMSGVVLLQPHTANDLKVSDKTLYINEPSEKGTSQPPYNVHNQVNQFDN